MGVDRAENGAQQIYGLHQPMVGEVIEDTRSLTAGDDQSPLPENAQVTRRGGLRQAELGAYVRDISSPAGEGIQQQQTSRVVKGTANAGVEFQKLAFEPGIDGVHFVYARMRISCSPTVSERSDLPLVIDVTYAGKRRRAGASATSLRDSPTKVVYFGDFDRNLGREMTTVIAPPVQIHWPAMINSRSFCGDRQ